MSGLLTKAGQLFVAPPEAVAAFAPPRPRHSTAGVLATEADLLVAAGAAAAELRRESRAAFALVCAWRAHSRPALAPPVPAVPAAARAAAKLARRELPARASGFLVVAELTPDADEAAAAARAAIAAVEAPAVLATARREPAMDVLLAGADWLVLALPADADPVLAELAAGDLAGLGPPLRRALIPPGFPARQAARLGIAPFAAARAPAPELV